ncbi:MAG: zinc ribbon domain-containing protein [Bacteroidales bacterium]
MVQQKQYICPKCGKREYELDSFAATGGGFAKLFDVQNKRYTTVTCKNCGYTEIYKRKTSQMGNIIDFLAGG